MKCLIGSPGSNYGNLQYQYNNGYSSISSQQGAVPQSHLTPQGHSQYPVPNNNNYNMPAPNTLQQQPPQQLYYPNNPQMQGNNMMAPVNSQTNIVQQSNGN